MHSHKTGYKWMDSHVDHDLISLLLHEVSNIVSPTISLPTHPISTWLTTRTVAETNIPPLHDFIEIIVRQSHTRTGTLLVALTLLTRLSCRLGHVTKGMRSSPQRIFLASLIISTKLIHDNSPKNKHWLTFSNNYFELAEINLMEKQFLTLMDFNLSITDYDFQQVVDRYRHMERDKKRGWQESPECPISPSQNVALSPGKNVIVTKRSLPLLSPSPTVSTPSTSASVSASSPSTHSDSPLLALSLSNTPVYDSSFNIKSLSALSTYSEDAYSVALEATSSKDSCDGTSLDHRYLNSCLFPLSSI